MAKKVKTLVVIYTAAALAALSVLSAVLYERSEAYGRAALYSSGAAFESAVKAADDMSAALKKSIYATDGGMCARLCGEIYADAQAAEAAISALPFDTFELEQISGFINRAGDYAYSLCPTAAEKGFGEDEAQALHEMSATAGELAERLRELQGEINNGTALMDERQEKLYNVGLDSATKLSEAMIAYESEFARPEPLSYDGKYTARQEPPQGKLSESEMKTLAARAAGVEERELKTEYEYEGDSLRRCYSAGERFIIVSARGLESIGCSRLVSEENIPTQEAEKNAADFLKAQGYEGLELYSGAKNGCLYAMSFVSREGDALCPNNTISVTAALDDGSIYAMNAVGYSDERINAEWRLTEAQAREHVPQSLEIISAEKLIIRSEGKRNVPCWRFTCENADGEVKIYVDAENGRQCRIEI